MNRRISLSPCGAANGVRALCAGAEDDLAHPVPGAATAAHLDEEVVASQPVQRPRRDDRKPRRRSSSSRGCTWMSMPDGQAAGSRRDVGREDARRTVYAQRPPAFVCTVAIRPYVFVPYSARGCRRSGPPGRSGSRRCSGSELPKTTAGRPPRRAVRRRPARGRARARPARGLPACHLSAVRSNPVLVGWPRGRVCETRRHDKRECWRGQSTAPLARTSIARFRTDQGCVGLTLVLEQCGELRIPPRRGSGRDAPGASRCRARTARGSAPAVR